MSFPGVYFVVLSFASLTCSYPPEVRETFEEVTISGIYKSGFETRSFTPCDSKERWWLPDPDISNRYHERNAAKPAVYWQIRIKARISPEGRYGHANSYIRCVTEVELLTALETQTNECLS